MIRRLASSRPTTLTSCRCAQGADAPESQRITHSTFPRTQNPLSNSCDPRFYETCPAMDVPPLICIVIALLVSNLYSYLCIVIIAIRTRRISITLSDDIRPAPSSYHKAQISQHHVRSDLRYSVSGELKSTAALMIAASLQQLRLHAVRAEPSLQCNSCGGTLVMKVR